VEALEVYTRARTHLAEQYGLDPGPQQRGVRGAILRDQLTVPEAQATPTADQPPAPAAGEAAEPVVPRQLPADLITFIGREKELDQLDALASGVDSPSSGLGIAVIDGMGGVGKTGLVVHATRQVAGRFPDGQLFIDLNGFSQQQAPVEAAKARPVSAGAAEGEHDGGATLSVLLSEPLPSTLNLRLVGAQRLVINAQGKCNLYSNWTWVVLSQQFRQSVGLCNNTIYEGPELHKRFVSKFHA
jgi:hypothetical protein